MNDISRIAATLAILKAIPLGWRVGVAVTLQKAGLSPIVINPNKESTL